ncbi:MAG: TonB-dependent receptor [Elusimicrobiota bacterium]
MIRVACLLLAALLALGAEARSQQRGLEDLLSYDLAELMNVEVVSPSKTPEPVSQAPATVRVITAEQIKERGYQTLEEALADLPGFQFRDISGFNSYSFMRGLPNQNNLLLLLVDGVQINELASGGFYGGGQHNLANVKRIEVVYGPASALYGTNAISGLINIITNDPRDSQGARGGLSAGSFGTRTADFSYGFHDKTRDCGVSMAGMLRRTDKADLSGDRGDGNWSPGMENFEEDQSFDGKLLYKALTLGVVYQDKQASRTTNEKTIGDVFQDFGTRWHIRFVNTYLKHLYDKDPGWSLESRVYYRNATVMDDTISSIKTTVNATGGQRGQYRPNDLFGAEGLLRLKPVKSLDLAVGAVAEREKLSKDFSTTYSGDPLLRPPTPGPPAMTADELVSLYTQARYEMFPGLHATGGVRYDYSSSYGHVPTPRGGIVYDRRELTLKLLYAEAFRAPKPWDLSFGSGNPNLAPEKMRSVELSGTYALTSRLLSGLSFYRNKVDKLLTSQADRWINTGSIETRGAEAEIEFVQGPVKAYANYTFTDSVDENELRVAEIARNSAAGGALFAFTRKVKLDLRARYLGGRKNTKTIAVTGSDRVGGAVVADATLSFLDIRGLDIQLMAKNLLDERYYHTSNRPPDRYRQPSRQLLLRIGYAFGLQEKP